MSRQSVKRLPRTILGGSYAPCAQSSGSLESDTNWNVNLRRGNGEYERHLIDANGNKATIIENVDFGPAVNLNGAFHFTSDMDWNFIFLL